MSRLLGLPAARAPPSEQAGAGRWVLGVGWLCVVCAHGVVVPTAPKPHFRCFHSFRNYCTNQRLTPPTTGPWRFDLAMLLGARRLPPWPSQSLACPHQAGRRRHKVLIMYCALGGGNVSPPPPPPPPSPARLKHGRGHAQFHPVFANARQPSPRVQRPTASS